MTKIDKKRDIMKSVSIVCLMAIAIVVFSTPAYAGFNWENNITVGTDGMTWGYTEQYTDENFVFYKSHIDSDVGNDDGYVSAWELLKIDSITREAFHDTIIKDMDVKINNSSTAIHLSEIDSSISEDILGKVYRRGEVTNYYKVMYSFDKTLTELGTNIWFLVEPETNVTITFPVGIDVTSTENIEDTTTIMHNNTTTIIGIVGFGGKISIGYAENKTWDVYVPEPMDDNNETWEVYVPEPMDDNNETWEVYVPEQMDDDNETSTEVEPHVPYNPVDQILEWLGLGTKR
ncbi:MAG TPA: hypothetical protein C5S51_01755 [Methanosarcinaceae archaeon]|nr:hypothetical protein [Methanosarcinaceae archaeon]